MTGPRFRNPDKFQVFPYREWLRKHFPPGNQGMVIEDLDLVIRVYGARYNTDEDGKFLLLELKYDNRQPGYAQQKTFGLIDKLLRQADPSKKIYFGYHVLGYDNEDWDKANFKLNNKSISREALVNFLTFRV